MATQRLLIDSDPNGSFSLRIEADRVVISGDVARGSQVLEHVRVTHISCVLEVEAEQLAVRNDEDGGHGSIETIDPGEEIDCGGCRLSLEVAEEAPAASAERTAAPARMKRR